MEQSEVFPEVASTLFAGLGTGAPDAGVDLPEPDAGDPQPLDPGAERHRRYLLQGEIGRGGMGVVYRVMDTDLRRTLAMKVLLRRPREDDGADGNLLARFLEEAQVTGQLDHPGIVPLHELGMDGRRNVYFTMRLVKGKDLAKVIELAHAGTEGWSLECAVEALVKVCDAMAYAHGKGVVHRDLKPQNIMAGRFGEVYVMDWGLAKVAGRPDRGGEAEPGATRSRLDVKLDEELRTADGWVLGTPAYMAPEQARGALEQIDDRSDVYALGAILYHLLAGHPPYLPGGARLPAVTVLQSVLAAPPTPLAEAAPHAPRDLVAVCEKAMEREKDERYAGMRELAADLRRWMAGRPVSARPRSAAARAATWLRQNPVATALLLAVTLGGAFGLWRLADLNRELLIAAARDSAAQEAAILERANELYTSAVTARVDREHVQVTHDYRDHPGAIPLPATFLTELAHQVSSSDHGVTVRHYSDHPFRFRGAADLDAFGSEALRQLRARPDQPVERVDTIAGAPVLRYAVARRMTQACVTCHNAHEESTKTDWAVGDVRGVLEVIRPLEHDEQRVRASVSGALGTTASVMAGLALLCAFALVRATRGKGLGSQHPDRG